MDSFTEFISVSLCGTAHQRDIGLRGLRLIAGAGEIYVLEGFWQLDPTETNVKILVWTNDLDSLVVKVANFCETYQKYASQESVFVTFKDKDRHEARVVYEGEWGKLINEVDRGSFLASFFSHQADVYDGRDEYPNH